MHSDKIEAILSRHGLKSSPELLVAIQEIINSCAKEINDKAVFESNRKDRMNGLR
ncbi:hypothetical protein [Candidatus Enterococcus huntleyi]|uniref:hypothetical protein n=1 Tax=Candidatus Enterococcus huntleyi TaxID=1857217 RepID=UPI00137943CF|nr:hypothetical protein [Enterococcus sp. JM4C]